MYKDTWSIAFDISTQGMIIPGSQENYDAELPSEYGNTVDSKTAELRNGSINRNVSSTSSQPTIYGGISTPVFSAPQDDYQSPAKYMKSTAFAEGQDIAFMPGVPILQLIVGLPTCTEVRLRFMTFPIQDESFYYFGIMANQRVDHWFELFEDDTTMALATNFAFHFGSRSPGIDMYSIALGCHWSKYLDD